MSYLSLLGRAKAAVARPQEGGGAGQGAAQDGEDAVGGEWRVANRRVAAGPDFLPHSPLAIRYSPLTLAAAPSPPRLRGVQNG
jgi:hypothetical protein